MEATAAAQQPPSPARESQRRQVAVSGNAESVPEVRVAAHETTYIHFDAPIERASADVEGRTVRFKWVDVGDTLVALEPSVDLNAEEKLVVRVRYKDNASPATATLALVTRPALVDKELFVARHPRTVEALEAALAEKDAQLAALRAVSGPAGLVFSGRLGPDGIQAMHIKQIPTDTRSGLKVLSGHGYRTDAWVLAVIRVQNLPGHSPWLPSVARLFRMDGTPVKVRAVDMNKPVLAPGEEGLVAVEAEAPSWKAGEKLRLEILDPSGLRVLPTVEVFL